MKLKSNIIILTIVVLVTEGEKKVVNEFLYRSF